VIFNSYPFLLFFTAFFALYWFIFKSNLKGQNALLLAGSYFFYAWADWRFLSYLVGISVLNFLLGIYIEKTQSEKKRKWLVNIGLLQGIGALAFFKYYNFFIVSINDGLKIIGLDSNLQTLQLLIPIGISFFTFRTVSYLLDVEKGKIEATKDWIVFFNYVAFFPAVLSGPIDKAKTFVPQLEKQREFTYELAVDGMRQVLWGLFKKIVIANNCAAATDLIFGNYQNHSSSTLLLGAFLYAIQIYADFSGYSDMAIGISKLLGFKITKNFEFPFFAQNIADFWRRWHISLTAWLTEYVFTPLSIRFRDYDKIGLILAIVINFTICGIWHGANWTYVLFGFLHGCYFIPLILRGTMNKKKKFDPNKMLPTFTELYNIATTFIVVMFTFIIFRSLTVTDAWQYFTRIFSPSILSRPDQLQFPLLGLIGIMLAAEWTARNKEYALSSLELQWKKPLRFACYFILLTAIFLFSSKEQEFIYFQF
jgi:alginate O-acetyltransferase complex protein AlgI